MTHFQFVFYSIIVGSLILLSAFFSAAETGLMALNRYRLRHRGRLKKRSALLTLKLLERPDRLLGTILIGNTCANIFASALATILAVHFFGEKGIIFSTILLTLVILIFSEVAPKTLAALYPDHTAAIVSWPIFILLIIFYPIVWLLNAISNGLLRILGVKLKKNSNEPLSREELRSVVYETTGRVSSQYQHMLLGILDLNKLMIDDVMVPRHEIRGIDLDEDWLTIQQKLKHSEHDWLPVYRDNINQIVGILHLRELLRESLTSNNVDKEKFEKILQEPYFIPQGTPLNNQLFNFQQQRKRFALVVDEYGEILGLVTLEDILEEVVGEFTTSVTHAGKFIEPQADGSFIVEGGVSIRDLNRITKFKLPTKGPRTLNGLIIEYLEAIPRTGTCLRILNYPIEIVTAKQNRVKIARIFPSSRED